MWLPPGAWDGEALLPLSVCAPAPVGVVGEANALLDRSQASVFRSQIMDEHVSQGKTTTYHFTLAPWGAAANRMTLQYRATFTTGCSPEIRSASCFVMARWACRGSSSCNAADIGPPSIPIVIRLERPFRFNADVVGLVGPQRGELDADLGEMQPGHLLVERFRQHVDLFFVFALVSVQFDLGQGLVGERRRHHK